MSIKTVFETCRPRADVLAGAVSEAEFAEVNGVGAAKLKEFAAPFLAAIAAAPANVDGGEAPHEGAP